MNSDSGIFILGIIIGLIDGVLIGSIIVNQKNAPILKATPIEMHWQKNLEETLFKNDQILVGSDGRIYAEIAQESGVWHVWHNGSGFGEYTTEQSAKKQAEDVAKRLGVKTY